jgi:hypothetical protein
MQFTIEPPMEEETLEGSKKGQEFVRTLWLWALMIKDSPKVTSFFLLFFLYNDVLYILVLVNVM